MDVPHYPEDSSVRISDSVVMGDVQQNITKIQQSGNSCPSCGTSGNIRLMICRSINCESKFCDLCHPISRYFEGDAIRFDSGKGEGPFCKGCMAIKHGEDAEKLRIKIAADKTREAERKSREEERKIAVQNKEGRKFLILGFIYGGLVIFWGIFNTIVMPDSDSHDVDGIFTFSALCCSPVCIVIILSIWDFFDDWFN
jgi:hypothetical protein